MRAAFCRLAGLPASAARLMLWYGAAPAPAPVQDALGVVALLEPADRARVTANLRAVVADAAEAGVGRLILAFAPFGVADPACRRTIYGDCYDPSTLDAVAAAIAAIVSDVTLPLSTGPRVLVDVSNEGCFGPDERLPFNHHAARLVPAVARRLVDPSAAPTRPAPDWGVSCAGDTPAALMRRADFTLARLEAAGLAPRFLAISVYGDDPGFVDVVSALAGRAEFRGIPLLVSEIPLDSRLLPDLARDAAAPSRLMPRAVIVWPKLAGGRCAIGFGALDAVERMLAGLASSPAARPPCPMP